MSTCPPPQSCRALALLAVLATAAAGGAAAEELCYPSRDPATPVPECVAAATGRVVACGTVGSVRLWPDGFRPAEAGGGFFREPGTTTRLQKLPLDRDTTERRGAQTIAGGAGHDDYHKAIDFAHGLMFVAHNSGVAAWDIRGDYAAHPRRVGRADGWPPPYGPGQFASFPEPTEQASFIEHVAVVPNADGSVTVLLSGKPPVGPTVWTYRDGVFTQRYQDMATNAMIKVLIVEHQGKRYGVGIGETYLSFFDLSRAEELNPEGTKAGVCLDEAGSNRSCGVHLGRIPIWSLQGDARVIDDRLFIVRSVTERPSILELALPLTPASIAAATQRWSGVELPPAITSPIFFQHRGHDYLALINGGRTAEIYDAACVAVDGCAGGIGNLLWRGSVPGTGVSNSQFLTFSRSGETPFLYFGVHGFGGSNGLNASGRAIEALWNLASLRPDGGGEIREITAGGATYTDPCTGRQVDYWSRYYPNNSYGLNDFQPFSGKFHGHHFYRVAQTVLEVHVLDESALGPRVDTAPLGAGPYWLGVGVPFAATAVHCAGDETWSWHSDNTLATGLDSTSAQAELTWLLCGSARCPRESARVWARKAACAADPALVENAAEIVLDDPRPRIDALTADPGTVFPVGSRIEVTSTVTGRPPITRHWAVRPLDGGGAEDLPTATGATLFWDTSGVVLTDELLIDGFESGDLAAWSAPAGASAATNAIVTPRSRDFEILLHATNADGAETRSLVVTLTELGELAVEAPR